MSDGRSKIILHMEMYEGEEYMKHKKYVHELGATAATSLHLTESLKGSGQTVMADLWFRPVKSAV